jgi:hypothetical protein
MQTAVGYLRVSTREQGRSGLGLAAQRHDIEAFGVREGFSIKRWHQVLRPAISETLDPEIFEGNKLADTEVDWPEREPQGSWDKLLGQSGSRRV